METPSAEPKESVLDDAKAYAEEVFDDEGDREKFVDTVNRLIDVPRVPEAAEGAAIDTGVSIFLRAWHTLT